MRKKQPPRPDPVIDPVIAAEVQAFAKLHAVHMKQAAQLGGRLMREYVSLQNHGFNLSWIDFLRLIDPNVSVKRSEYLRSPIYRAAHVLRSTLYDVRPIDREIAEAIDNVLERYPEHKR